MWPVPSRRAIKRLLSLRNWWKCKSARAFQRATAPDSQSEHFSNIEKHFSSKIDDMRLASSMGNFESQNTTNLRRFAIPGCQVRERGGSARRASCNMRPTETRGTFGAPCPQVAQSQESALVH